MCSLLVLEAISLKSVSVAEVSAMAGQAPLGPARGEPAPGLSQPLDAGRIPELMAPASSFKVHHFDLYFHHQWLSSL